MDPCAFFLKKQGELILIIGIHVDDCAIAGKPSNVQWFKSLMKKYFTIKELGILYKHLGVWDKWSDDTTGRYLEASMEDFVTFMIEEFKTLFKKLPQTAMTPALSGTILKN